MGKLTICVVRNNTIQELTMLIVSDKTIVLTTVALKN